MEQANQITGVDPQYAVKFDSDQNASSIEEAEAKRVAQVVEWFTKCENNMSAKRSEWEANLRDYLGVFSNPENYPLDSKLYLRLTYSHVQTVTARMSGFPLKTDVMPISDNSEAAAEAADKMSSLLEYYFELADVDTVRQYMLQSACIFGTGVIHPSWDFKQENLKYRSVKVGPEGMKNIVEEQKKIVTKDQPVLVFISPFDFFIEPGATTVQNSKYCIHRTYMTEEKLREKALKQIDVDAEGKPVYQGMYVNVDKAIKDCLQENQTTTLQSQYGESQGSGRIEVIRCWTSDRRVIEIAGRTVLLRDAPNDLYSGKKPFVTFPIGGLPDQIYGEGEVAPVKPLHQAISDTINLMVVNGNLSVNKVFKRRVGAYNTDQIIRISPGKVFDVLDSDDLQEFPITDSRQGTQMQLSTLLNFSRTVSSNPTLSTASPVSSSATDSSGGKSELLQLSDGRIALIETTMMRAWGEIIDMVGSMIQQYMSEPAIVRVFGQGGDGKMSNIKVAPEDIVGHRFLYKPTAKSLNWFGEELRRQQFINFLNIAGKLQDTGPDGQPYVVGNTRELFLKVLEMFRVPAPERYVHRIPVAPPVQPPPAGMQGMPTGQPPIIDGQAGPPIKVPLPPMIARGMNRNPTGTPYQNNGPGIVSPDQLPTGTNVGDMMRQLSASGKEN